MGYTTDFTGRFELNRPLEENHAAYIAAFCDTRRMMRDAEKTGLREDPRRTVVSLPVGEQGGYFVGETGFAGQDHGEDILNYNSPPAGQPGLWCHWVPTSDRAGIEWDGGEKFYDYAEWLEYIIKHFLAPWGYVLNGEVKWAGEESSDLGKLIVTDNAVSKRAAKISY